MSVASDSVVPPAVWHARMARLTPVLAIVAVVGAAYLPIVLRFVQHGDFPAHIEAAEDLLDGIVRVPHLLFHAAVAALILAGARPQTAAIVVTLTLQVAAALSVFWFARRSADAAPGVAATLAILVLGVGPIVPPNVGQNLFMTGYFLPNSIHNPTVIAAKAFVPALLVIGASAAGLAIPAFRRAAAASLVVLAGLAKPHYVSCVVAAALACASGRWLARRRVPWRPLTFELVVPGLLIILWAVVGNIEMSSGGAPTLAPLAVLRSHGVAVDPVSLLQRFASDAAFPATILLLWGLPAVRFPPLALAWTAYGAAAAQAFLLAESGERLESGNVMWSGQLAMFGLMAASAAFLARERRFTVRTAIAFGVLLLHVASGVSWARSRLAE